MGADTNLNLRVWKASSADVVHQSHTLQEGRAVMGLSYGAVAIDDTHVNIAAAYRNHTQARM